MRTKVDFSITAEIVLGITRKNSKDYSVKLDAYSALYLEYYTLSCSWKKYGITRRDTGGQQEEMRLWKGFDRRKDGLFGLEKRGQWTPRCLRNHQ